MGRVGNSLVSKTAKNGWAAGLTDEKDNDSPRSTRSRRDCTTGTDATAEKTSPAVIADRLLAKS